MRFDTGKRTDSIRFMMSWECYGSIAWCVQRIYQKRNVVAGLCLDGLGGKPEFGGKTKLVILNPHCQVSFTDYAAAEVAKACSQGESGFTFKTTPWSGGTDHTIFERVPSTTRRWIRWPS